MVWKVSHCFCINPLCNVWKRDRESTQRRWAELSACGARAGGPSAAGPVTLEQLGQGGLCPLCGTRAASKVLGGLGHRGEGSQKGWRGPGGFASPGWSLANSSLAASWRLFCTTCSLQPGLRKPCRVDFGPGFGHPWGQSFHRDQ